MLLKHYESDILLFLGCFSFLMSSCLLHLDCVLALPVLMSYCRWSHHGTFATVSRLLRLPDNDPVKLKKHKVMAQAFSKRRQVNNGRLSLSFISTHDDPLGKSTLYYKLSTALTVVYLISVNVMLISVNSTHEKTNIILKSVNSTVTQSVNVNKCQQYIPKYFTYALPRYFGQWGI